DGGEKKGRSGHLRGGFSRERYKLGHLSIPAGRDCNCIASLADGVILRGEFERHENRRRATRKIPFRGVGKALFITRALRFFETEIVLKIFFGRRGQKDYFGDTFTLRAFEEFLDELIADPLALILGKYGGGTKKPQVPMTFQADTAKNLAPTAPSNEKAAEMLFHTVVREIYLRKNLKNIVQTYGGGILDGDELGCHIIV